ncbi:MAG: UDP-N-acetylmuramoyl-L-alanine--D-glutamate ligase [Gammaproteobacteria bacterium]|nr:UDP-N-acetylmuramoyl-L-alanine--D-glutamate ligase [Gammaproteobacteria bacterium]
MSLRSEQRELVLGFGLTGASIARFLGTQGKAVVVADDDPSCFDRERGPGLDHCQFVPADRVLAAADEYLATPDSTVYVSPGVRPDHPLVALAIQRGLRVCTDIDLFMRHCRAPVISVTGTNGKSTVARLIGHLLGLSGLRAPVGGNIGAPALDLLDAAADYYVLELSSFQLHYSTLNENNHVGILTNIASDHLDFHHNLDDYIACKRQIFAHNRFSIYYRDQYHTRLPCNRNSTSNSPSTNTSTNSSTNANANSGTSTSLSTSSSTNANASLSANTNTNTNTNTNSNTNTNTGASSSTSASFGYGRSQREGDYGLLRSGDGLCLTRGNASLLTLGDDLARPLCFYVNLMPALAVLDWLGLRTADSARQALELPLLEHRYDRVASDDGVCWINASKATNPQATISSLPVSIDKSILLLGGSTKGTDLSVLSPHLRGIKKVVAFSENADDIATSLDSTIAVETCADLDEAVQACRRSAVTGDTVVLAPAAASQPVYRNYRERGLHFSQLVGQPPPTPSFGQPTSPPLPS